MYLVPRVVSCVQAPDHGVMTTPAPHPHWTIYEALQQPMAIARALAFGGKQVIYKFLVVEAIHPYSCIIPGM